MHEQAEPLHDIAHLCAAATLKLTGAPAFDPP